MRFLRIAGALAAPFVLVAALAAQSLEMQLQRAVQREAATGDHKAAIKEYQGIADRAGSNRAVAVQALLRLAEAHEKAGDAEANKVYEQIVARFGDQVEIAALARTRLGSVLAAGDAAPRRIGEFRLGGFPAISPDGRSLVFGANDVHDLVIRDIASGRERTVVHDANGTINGPAFSRDGKRIAFVYTVGNRTEIRVIDASGGAARTVPGTSATRPVPTPTIHDWSPDGRRVLVRSSGDGGSRLVWLNVTDGTRTTLAEVAENPDGRFRAAVSPDGRQVVFGGVSASPTNRASRSSDSGREIHTIASDGRGERVLSSVGGDLYPVGWTSDGRAALVVSRRSNTIGLWAFPLANGVAAGEPRVIERDLCSCGELTGSNPELESFLSVIGTTRRGDFYYQTRMTRSDIYIARLDPATGRATSAAVPVNTSRKGSNVRPIWSPDGKRLLFFWSTPSGRELSMFTMDDGVERRFALDLDPFGVCWAGSDAFIYRRASSDATPPFGAVEFRRYDLANGRDQVVFEDEAAFFSCSADGATVAYRSPPRRGGVGGFLTTRHLVSGATSKREFPRETNPVTKLSPRGDELAFFALTAGAPQPLVTAADTRAAATASWRLLIAPAASGSPEREIARAAAGEQFQIGGGNEGLAWSADGRFMYYAKQLAAGGDFELFRAPTGGGPEERLGLAGVELRDLSVSPDGSRMAFAMGPLNRLEIWAVQNVSGTK